MKYHFTKKRKKKKVVWEAIFSCNTSHGAIKQLDYSSCLVKEKMKTLKAFKTNICPAEVTLSKAESLIEVLGLIKYNIITTDFRLNFTSDLSIPLINAFKRFAICPYNTQTSLSFITLYRHLFNVYHY